MPGVSRPQQSLFGMCAHTDHPPAACPKMSRDKMREFAHGKNLPSRAPAKPVKGLSKLLA